MSHQVDRLFDALADDQRRELLFALLKTDARSETSPYSDSSPDETIVVSGDRLQRQHVHLPKLADYGFIEWEGDGNAVERGPQFEAIRPLLEVLHVHREELRDCGSTPRR
ncbi:hypothetical protein [Natrarchaeobius oligotrophus]|uniref:ArsR family transcriptional regulator n=1 Tax=Natrarchaeobius chitinivorans TaxID=1679083 RepID=A0A3N6MJ37_NATCH|nr:hypothetical protein [Natrarchaeobius chitinivorans]RQH03338.1 hypothetical protein EA472_01815 [Natrarchaeobius chitinivorans]